ncbi:hypothetical protein [Pediococcus pentosaceus]|uniref:hypothetical protein n=1 Tax=Pediococcus pentosaceus TaxID=1255 RepID=UPI001F58C1F3|nr:hypothetical protein [Pediococcus pentosaceus]MCI2961034.1 hypothetical protein [Pediococcus pentosaceus]
MKNVYVVKLGKLYLKQREDNVLGEHRYIMIENLNNANFFKNFDYTKERAEEIGGKVYEINLEEVED